jgi:hypothetical protein
MRRGPGSYGYGGAGRRQKTRPWGPSRKKTLRVTHKGNRSKQSCCKLYACWAQTKNKLHKAPRMSGGWVPPTCGLDEEEAWWKENLGEEPCAASLLYETGEGSGEPYERTPLNGRPRRNMSVSDMNAKRSGSFKLRLQRSSMSDLTDEASASATNVSASECDLKMPYFEIITIAGVSDIPILYGQETEEVPSAPSSVRRSKAETPKSKPKAIVSLVSPHKLLMLSKDFCDLFGFSVESEICGRAVKILQGPRTDSGLLVSAIKNAAMGMTTCTNVVLYDREGADIELEIKFSPYMSGDDMLAGCLLELLSPVPVT